MYTENAMAFPPDSPVVTGRAALRTLWQSSREGGVDRVVLRTEGVEGAGKLAVETGTGVLDVRAADGKVTQQHMKFVVVWRQEADGVWRLHRDIWNSLPAPK
jgi:ketosteroid isomerase-like protein